MKLTDDLKSPRLIHAKGFLFLLLGLIGTAGILLESPKLRTALLLVIVIWAFCRFYYYLFYVLERYLGKESSQRGQAFSIRKTPSEKGITPSRGATGLFAIQAKNDRRWSQSAVDQKGSGLQYSKNVVEKRLKPFRSDRC